MKSYKEMAQEIDQLKDSGKEFDGLLPVKARIAKDIRSVFSLRLAPGELTEIAEAAAARDMKIGDFIRTAALVAAKPAAEDLESTLDLIDKLQSNIDELVLILAPGSRKRRQRVTSKR